MKKTTLMNNENGSVVVLALIMVVLLSLLGMAVSRTSSIDVQVASNETQAVQNLYQAESADHYALEATGTWMTNAFLTGNQTQVNYDNPLDLDNDGNDDVRIEVRCIESSGTKVVPPYGTLSDGANDLPRMQHKTVPPPGSGYSLKYFEIRRYGITGTSLNGGTQVQIGAYKVFNKF
jgi:Tfp pilus assembly protein PilX